jgi:NAD(P)H-hydrate epimerase
MILPDIPHSHYICTAEQSRLLDKATIEEFGISGYTLMEVAGSKTANHLLSYHGKGDHGLILCGKGNNGGDALVVARYLAQHRIDVTLVFISGIDDLSEDADQNFRLLQKMDQHSIHGDHLHFISSWQPDSLTDTYDFIVDGMLGTGLDSDLRGDYEKAVSWANECSVPKYAIDIPTGLHADRGDEMGEILQADETFTFGGLKQGFYLNEGLESTGQTTYCDLPFPNYLKEDFSTALIDSNWVDPNFPINRSPAQHKYEAGVLYVIAGSEGLTGAAIMAAKSAWAEGIGAVILICPRGLLSIFETNLTQIITRPVGKEHDFHFTGEHCDKIVDIIEEKPGKIIFGPGIGRADETVRLTHNLLDQYSGDMLIDADGLWCLAQRDWKVGDDQNLILTPHPGELGRLLGKKVKDDYDRLQKVRQFARNQGVYLLSKGYPIILATPDNTSYLSDYDTRKFSRAGFGDILAGKIGAFWTLCNRASQACWHGLLNGQKKLNQLKHDDSDTQHWPEPLDLI